MSDVALKPRKYRGKPALAERFHNLQVGEDFVVGVEEYTKWYNARKHYERWAAKHDISAKFGSGKVFKEDGRGNKKTTGYRFWRVV